MLSGKLAEKREHHAAQSNIVNAMHRSSTFGSRASRVDKAAPIMAFLRNCPIFAKVQEDDIR